MLEKEICEFRGGEVRREVLDVEVLGLVGRGGGGFPSRRRAALLAGRGGVRVGLAGFALLPDEPAPSPPPPPPPAVEEGEEAVAEETSSSA